MKFSNTFSCISRFHRHSLMVECRETDLIRINSLLEHEKILKKNAGLLFLVVLKSIEISEGHFRRFL